MRVLAIDPGTTKSGWCLLEDGVPTTWGWEDNDFVQEKLAMTSVDSEVGVIPDLVIEDIGNYGMPMGRDTIETIRWTGKFEASYLGEVHYLLRPTIKTHLCNAANAKDANVRQALIDRYGGDEVAVGGKKCGTCKGKGWKGRGRAICPDCFDGPITDRTFDAIGTGYETPPGPLHGLTGHCWSALACGITYLDTKEQPQ